MFYKAIQLYCYIMVFLYKFSNVPSSDTGQYTQSAFYKLYSIKFKSIATEKALDRLIKILYMIITLQNMRGFGDKILKTVQTV
jgi:hypothetical protein